MASSQGSHLSPSTNDKTKLSPLKTHWSNLSHTSINTSTSEAATFHSAFAGPPSTAGDESRTCTPGLEMHNLTLHQSPILKSMEMARKDSGYSATSTPTQQENPRLSRRSSSRRASSSTTRTATNRRTSSPVKPPRRVRNNTSSSITTSSVPISRPPTNRASRSSSHVQPLPSRRPSLPSRGITTPVASSSSHNSHSFFHFPSLSPNTSPENSHITNRPSSSTTAPIPPRTPPPATTHYWLSDSTRRLEYAAIDAAGRGFRGLCVRLAPDCILPKEMRRVRFFERETEELGRRRGAEEGSVRRYRLELPDEEEKDVKTTKGQRRRSLWQRLGFGRGVSC